MAQTVKNSPAMRETWVQSLGQEDPLEKEMATHSRILAWEVLCPRDFPLWERLVSQMVKHLPAMQKTGVPSLGQEDPLEKGTAIHSSILV